MILVDTEAIVLWRLAMTSEGISRTCWRINRPRPARTPYLDAVSTWTTKPRDAAEVARRSPTPTRPRRADRPGGFDELSGIGRAHSQRDRGDRVVRRSRLEPVGGRTHASDADSRPRGALSRPVAVDRPSICAA